MDCKGIIGVFRNRTFWIGMVMIMIAVYMCSSTQLRLSLGIGGLSRLCSSGFMRTCVFHMEKMRILRLFVAELLMNIYFLPGSGDNMDLRSLLDWVSLISLVDFYTYCTKYKILPSPSCSAIVLRHDSIANIQHW